MFNFCTLIIIIEFTSIFLQLVESSHFTNQRIIIAALQTLPKFVTSEDFIGNLCISPDQD